MKLTLNNLTKLFFYRFQTLSVTKHFNDIITNNTISTNAILQFFYKQNQLFLFRKIPCAYTSHSKNIKEFNMGTIRANEMMMLQ